MCWTGTGTFGNIAVPPLPELPLHKFHRCAIRRNRRKDIVEKSILWIFQDSLLIRVNQTVMMRLVEHRCGSNFRSTQAQECSGEDWE